MRCPIASHGYMMIFKLSISLYHGNSLKPLYKFELVDMHDNIVTEFIVTEIS